MKYTAKGTHNRHFELMDENNFALGKLDYTSWFTIKSEIKLPDGRVLNIAPTNIWHTSIDLTAGDHVLASLKLNWKGQTVVSLNDGDNYIFKRRGFFNMHFGLFNRDEHEVVIVNQKFELSKLSFNYYIETDDNYNEGKNVVLILLLVYCANYMHSMHGG